MRETIKAVLELEDGTIYEGKSFGCVKPCAGEVVFNTAMTGYPESLTDPSYEGQILVTTYPLLGNYGVPPKTAEGGIADYLESDRIHCEAIICQDYSWAYSHWLAEQSLSEWLVSENIPGICGIDTRALTKRLREKGSMLGRITFEGERAMDFVDPNKENLLAKVSCQSLVEYGNGGKTVVLVDCGVKNNIIRSLLKRGVKVVRVPWNYDFNTMDFDGLFISNGPGDPDMAGAAVDNIRKALSDEKPVCGICMGNQLLAKAAVNIALGLITVIIAAVSPSLIPTVIIYLAAAAFILDGAVDLLDLMSLSKLGITVPALGLETLLSFVFALILFLFPRFLTGIVMTLFAAVLFASGVLMIYGSVSSMIYARKLRKMGGGDVFTP